MPTVFRRRFAILAVPILTVHAASLLLRKRKSSRRVDGAVPSSLKNVKVFFGDLLGNEPGEGAAFLSSAES